jgi:hypothetical protein
VKGPWGGHVLAIIGGAYHGPREELICRRRAATRLRGDDSGVHRRTRTIEVSPMNFGCERTEQDDRSGQAGTRRWRGSAREGDVVVCHDSAVGIGSHPARSSDRSHE